MENFTLDRVGLMYEKYFQDVLNVYTGQGWYSFDEARPNSFNNHLAKRYT